MRELWDFLGSQQFTHLLNAISIVMFFVIVPIYRRVIKVINHVARIPAIEAILVDHDDRLIKLEQPRHFTPWHAE